MTSPQVLVLTPFMLDSYLSEKQIITRQKKEQKLNEKSLSHKGSATVQISNKFIADLKRIAELDTKMTEYNDPEG